MAGVANGDGDMPAEFFPGIRWAGTLSPGSRASRTPPPDTAVPDGDSGIPGTGTALHLSYMVGPGESMSTSQPGQTDGSEISPGEDGQYADSGARSGSDNADHFHRYTWQSAPEET